MWLLEDEERKKAIVDGLRTSSGDLRVVNEGQRVVSKVSWAFLSVGSLYRVELKQNRRGGPRRDAEPTLEGTSFQVFPDLLYASEA